MGFGKEIGLITDKMPNTWKPSPNCNCDECSDAHGTKTTPCPEFCEFYPPRLDEDERREDEREKSFYDADGKRKPLQTFSIEMLREINEMLKKFERCNRCWCEFPKGQLKKIPHPDIARRFLMVCKKCE